MYKIKIENFEKIYLLDEMIKIFLRPSEYSIVPLETSDEDCDFIFNRDNFSDKNKIKEEIYLKLSKLTGVKPEWGILTGIRPVKLCGEIYETAHCNEEATLDKLLNYFHLSEEKAKYILDMYLYQQKHIGKPLINGAGVYIGIPFCPTRCVYCSFTSNQVKDTEIERYLKALLIEIEYVGRRMKETGIIAESIYVGGGTPTTLNPNQLDRMLTTIKASFDMTNVIEFTVECGRPDTITEEKLRVLSNHGVDRISINPQSMKDETLALIGRSHSSEEIVKAFSLAKKFNFKCINADIIAGLPKEDINDFKDTLKKVIELEPENITVHCLAVKRASKLVALDEEYHYKQAKVVENMLEYSREILSDYSYLPYYLYRQKHMAGALENTGYTKAGYDGVYNVRIMEEHENIIALGSGGISKAYYPDEDRLERIPNVANYEEYISRIDEMLDRKENNLFRR